MSGINIDNTDRFSEISNYLNNCIAYLDSESEELNNIGNGTYNTVRDVYNRSSTPVKEKINSLKDKISKANSHITSSLGVYYTVDDALGNKLNEIYDDIFNDQNYENKLIYVTSGEDKKLSYEEFIELVNSSDEYFELQRKKAYDEFFTKMVTKGPAIIKKLGSDAYNAVVENTYLCISDEKIGTNEYKKGLQKFKDKFANEINKHYTNTDFVPECYLKDQNEYNQALIKLSFDPIDDFDMRDLLTNTFNSIDERAKLKELEISQGMYIVDSLYKAKDIFNDVPNTTDPKELLNYYTDAINDLKCQFNLTNDNNPVICDSTYYPDYDKWYDTIKDTEAFKKIKDLLPDNKQEIYNMTNKLDFLSAVYQYDGMESLQELYSGYISKCIGYDAPKEYIINGDLDRIVLYSIENTTLSTLYQPIMDTKANLNTINDSEDTALLLFAKNLDTSDITDSEYQSLIKDVDSYWKNYCGDYQKYLDDWQLKAYAKILTKDKDLAAKLLNKSDGKDRGILNDKIMEGAAFDEAKKRVYQMVGNNNDGTLIDEYLKSIIFSSVYGFGYGITDFTTGISDVFLADGKLDRRQMEKNNIMALLSSDYSLQAKYYNKDPELMEKYSSNYSDEFIKSIKLGNFSNEEINEFITDCKNNNVPRYEVEYYMGMISYDEFIKYQSIANLSEEDLAYYANINNETGTRWWADKSFKVSNSVGTMAIPTALSILASATGPVGGIPVSGFSQFISTSASLLSYSSMFASSLGRNREGLMQSGETNNTYIWTNALLHSAMETFGEMALGKILKPNEVSAFVKNVTAKEHPFLGAIINASDDFEAYLLRNNCNPRLAKYLSSAMGEVIQENMENVFGHGIDLVTDVGASIFDHREIKTPSIEELLEEAWETTWLTALTTPILNGMTDMSLSNVIRTIDINGREVNVSLSDILLFTDEANDSIDYEGLSRYLLSRGQMDEEIINDVVEICRIRTIGELNDANSSIIQTRLNLPSSHDLTLDENTVLEYSLGDINIGFNANNLSPETLRRLNTRIIEEQDNIVINNALNFEYTGLTDYILSNPNLLSELSTENLVRLAASPYGANALGDITSEIRTRFENGESIYATNSLTKIIFGSTWDSNNMFLRNLTQYDPELSNAIIEKEAETYKLLPQNIRDILDSSKRLSNGSKLALASMYMNNQIDQKGIEIVESLEGNTSKIKTFNYELLNKDIINDLGVDLVTDLGRYSDLSSKIVSLKKSDSKVYNALVAMISNASIDDSLQNKSINIENAINFMFNNSKALEGNIESINLESLQEYINLTNRVSSYYSLEPSVIPNFSNNFIEDYNANIDKNAEKVIQKLKEDVEDQFSVYNVESGVKKLKNLYYNRFFQSSDNDINDLITKYSNNIDYIRANNPDNKYVELLDYMVMVNNIEDPDTMIKLYQNSNNVSFTAEEIAAFDNFMRTEYVDTYLKSFNKTNNEINAKTHIEEHNGKQVKVADMDGDFSIFVHSSDTGFTEDKEIINNSFVDTFKMTSNASIHGVSTSFITQDNMGSAPVGKNGVLYGFTNLQNQDVQSMGPADINSKIAAYGFNSGEKQQYVVADQMSKETLRLYNEVVLNRDTVTPSCIVLLSDASPEVVENSYNAASEWNIPVVKIDVNNVAQKQTNSIKSDIINYEQTGNMNYLKSAIQNYESGTAGFNLNAIQEKDKFSNVHGDVSNYYESLDMENQLIEVAKRLKSTNSTNEIDEFIYMIDNIKKTYTALNENNNPTAKTQSMINYDNILEVLVGNE